MQRFTKLLALAACALAALAGPAVAQDWPAKPIRLIVPFAPGGSSDAAARPIADRLAVELGQPVVVENRSGGQTVVGAELVFKSPPDGYTLFLMPGTHLLDRYLVKVVPFDPVADFTPIAKLVSVPFVFVTGRQQPFGTLKEMLDHGEKDKGVAIGNTDALGLLAAESLKGISKIRLTPVTYRGSPAIVADVIGGHLDAGTTTPPVVMGYSQQKNGPLNVLAVTSARRLPSLPDVPTVTEATGLKGYEFSTWYGILGPPHLPAPIVARLEKAVTKVMNETPLRARLLSLGLVIADDFSPRAMRGAMRTDTDHWSKLADKAGLRP